MKKYCLFLAEIYPNSEFVGEFIELPLFFKAFRAPYSEMICIFLCFYHYGYFTRESLCDIHKKKGAR